MAEDEFGRVPPQDVDAEISVLGAMMLSKEAIDEVSQELRGTDYYKPAHEVIHDVILELSGRGEPADAVTVAGELKRKGDLDRVGGATYLHTLVSSVPTAANAGYYARLVKEQAILRRLVEAGTRIVQLGYADAGGDVDEIVDEAEQEVFSVADRRNQQDYVAFSDMGEELLMELESIESNKGKMTGVPTGFTQLDDLTNGLHPGQMIIVAARPAMGKSTLAIDFCRSAALHHDVTSVVFSLEMGRNEIMQRIVSAESGVMLSKMRKGDLSQGDWQRIAKTVSDLSQKPFYIDDSPNMAMNEIRSKCRRLKQSDNLGLVVIDYLQLMSSGKKVESRQQEVSEFSRQLKLLAKEIECPVIAVAQLNRGPEARTDKKPMMSDLRESGSLEQDADIIMLLHRPDYYDAEERPGEADLIVAKHRNGATDTIRLAFQGHLARFANLAYVDEPQG